MNDADIIKALECCEKTDDMVDACAECPYKSGGCATKEQSMPRDAIALINRLKEEIDKVTPIQCGECIYSCPYNDGMYITCKHHNILRLKEGFCSDAIRVQDI